MHNKKYFTIEVLYRRTPIDSPNQVLPGSEFCKFRLQNCTAAHVKDFRNTIFFEGLLIWQDADTGYIIPPNNVSHIEVFRQSHFFRDAELNKPLKKSDK